MTTPFDRVLLLAGGVGGARMAEGLKHALPPGALTVIANVGDDETFHGLHVSPDIDTIIYTLSDRIDRRQGWGVRDDALRAQGVLAELGAPVWMQLGDADLGLHIWRTERLAAGAPLSQVTAEAAARLGAGARILPVTDDRLRTRLLTEDGWMDFQPWFVGARCAPAVREIAYEGAPAARPAPGVIEAIAAADLIVIAPSNPLLSIDPILAVPGLRAALAAATAPRIAVSPLIGGKAVKGPLARLIADLGLPPGARGVVGRYAGLIDGFALDPGDRDGVSGPALLATDILMRGPADATRLAREILAFAGSLAR